MLVVAGAEQPPLCPDPALLALNLTDKVPVICLHLTVNTPAVWRGRGRLVHSKARNAPTKGHSVGDIS